MGTHLDAENTVNIGRTLRIVLDLVVLGTGSKPEPWPSHGLLLVLRVGTG
jgi:hypothetical protein